MADPSTFDLTSTPRARARRCTNSASSASCGARLNSSSARHVSRTRLGGALGAERAARASRPPRSSASLSRWIAASSAPTATATRSRYHARELLELREQLLALGAARGAPHPLLRLARRQLEPSMRASSSSRASVGARLRVREQHRGRRAPASNAASR